MKYYDGMGKDVTAYVAGLEKRVVTLQEELEKLLVVTVEPKIVEDDRYEPDEDGEFIITDEKPKSKKRRKKQNAVQS